MANETPEGICRTLRAPVAYVVAGLPDRAIVQDVARRLGRCQMHPQWETLPGKRVTVSERSVETFLGNLTEVRRGNKCVTIKLSPNSHGYAKIAVGFEQQWKTTVRGKPTIARKSVRKTLYAHRFAYLLMYGYLPPSLHIAHLCNNTICCCHLEAQSLSQNVGEVNARCLRGAALTLHLARLEAERRQLKMWGDETPQRLHRKKTVYVGAVKRTDRQATLADKRQLGIWENSNLLRPGVISSAEAQGIDPFGQEFALGGDAEDLVGVSSDGSGCVFKEDEIAPF